VRQLALLLRDRRDQVYSQWLGSLKGSVGEEYRDLLESPIGARLLRRIIDDLVALAQAEAYEVAGITRQVENEAAADAARRGALGFELVDVIAALQQVRGAVWKVLTDALVVGELPAFGETMDEMSQIDAFIDRLVQVEVRGYLAGQSAPRPAAADDD
jgi:hypothetical protein